jgi:hypothetical protein
VVIAGPTLALMRIAADKIAAKAAATLFDTLENIFISFRGKSRLRKLFRSCLLLCTARASLSFPIYIKWIAIFTQLHMLIKYLILVFFTNF